MEHPLHKFRQKMTLLGQITGLSRNRRNHIRLIFSEIVFSAALLVSIGCNGYILRDLGRKMTTPDLGWPVTMSGSNFVP